MTGTISEDTPENNTEELQWKIDRLVEQVELHTAKVKEATELANHIDRRLDEANEKFDRLVGRLTVGALRSAGVKVEITVPDPWDDCGCCD